LNNSVTRLTDQTLEPLPISDRNFDDQRLPEVSLSPAMTFHGAWSEKDVIEVGENIDHDNDNEESGDA
jgi:hypothetical protein